MYVHSSVVARSRGSYLRMPNGVYYYTYVCLTFTVITLLVAPTSVGGDRDGTPRSLSWRTPAGCLAHCTGPRHCCRAAAAAAVVAAVLLPVPVPCLLLLLAVHHCGRLQRVWAAAGSGSPHARPRRLPVVCWHLCLGVSLLLTLLFCVTAVARVCVR